MKFLIVILMLVNLLFAGWVNKYERSGCKFDDVRFRDSLNGVVVGQNADHDGIILVTDDGGETWEIVSDGEYGKFTSVTYSEKAEKWFAGGSGFFIADSNARNWTIEQEGSCYGVAVNYWDTQVFTLGSSTGQISYYKFNDESYRSWTKFVGMSLYSIDKQRAKYAGGYNCMINVDTREEMTMNDLLVYEIYGMCGDYAVGGSKQYYHRSVGTRWNSVPLPSDLFVGNDGSVHFWDVMKILGEVNTWMVGDYGYIIKNDGEGWSKMDSHTENKLHGVYFVTAELGFAVGENGTILKYTPLGTAVEKAVKASITKLAVYPNPFNPTAIISFYTGSKGGNMVNLSVYSTNGQLVRRLVCGRMNGHQEIQFDGTDLNSGVYVCRLEVGAEVNNIKLIVEK